MVVVRWHAILVYGADRNWTLLTAAGSILVALLWFYYAWRQTRPERALRRMSRITRIDRMSGRQFEKYCIRLLQALGYQIVAWTGGTRSDQGGDIIAISPRGVEIAVQCKRRKAKLGPNVIRELIGATASGMHKGRAGMVMTNAIVTDGARAYARRNGIRVVDQPVLQYWMDRVRLRLDQRQARRTNLITLVTLVMLGALCSAVIAMSIVMDQGVTHPLDGPGAELTIRRPCPEFPADCSWTRFGGQGVFRGYQQARLEGSVAPRRKEHRAWPVRHLQGDGFRLPPHRQGHSDKPQRDRRLSIRPTPGL
jgi:HJR/Mrr/RecB family endonuclease